MSPLPEWVLIWTAVLGFVATIVLVVVSALVERSGPIRLRHWVEKANGRLLALYTSAPRFSAFRFLLSLLARLAPLVSVLAAWEVLRLRQIEGGPWIAAGGALVLLAVLEWFNRYLVEHEAETALRRSTLILRPLVWLLAPLIFILAPLAPQDDGDEDEDEEDDASDDEIDAFIDVGVREGILEPEEEAFVRGIVDFGDTQVRSVMTPRVEMVAAQVEAAHEDIARRFFDSKHARLPLYRDSIDEIVGILHIRDIFEAIETETRTAPAELANPPLYVPESKTLRDLLEEMQTLHQQMAIVVDEYGGVAGLVTVEDLVEEIVGDISDEHERRKTEREKLGEEGWRLPGRTDLEDLEELFGLEADDLPFETVSGLVCGELGYVPKPGEVVEVHGLVFTIEKADERRVTSVEVRRAPAQEPA